MLSCSKTGGTVDPQSSVIPVVVAVVPVVVVPDKITYTFTTTAGTTGIYKIQYADGNMQPHNVDFTGAAWTTDITPGLNWKTAFNSFCNPNFVTNVYNGVVIQCLSDKTLACDSKTGSLLWQIPISTLPAFKGDTVFNGYGNQVHALKSKTGTQIWQTSLPDYDISREMMVIGNTVFAGRGGSSQSVLHTASGRNSYRLKTSDGSPLTLNGTPASDYNQLQVLPAITIKGRTYYDNASGMSRSY